MFQYTIWWTIRASTAVGSTMWHQRHSSYARRGNFNHLPPTWRGYTYQLLRDATTSQLRLTMTRVSGNFYYYLDSKELLASTQLQSTTTTRRPVYYQSTTTLDHVQSSQTITIRSSSSSLRSFTNYDVPPTTHLQPFTTTAVSNC